MIEQTNRLSELDNGDIVLTLGDKELSIKRLAIGDFAKATNLLRANRQKAFIEATRMINMPSEVRAKTMAEIACASITLLDLVDDWDMRITMIQWSMSKAGYGGTIEKAKKDLDDLSIEDIGRLLDTVTGLGLFTKAGSDENPTTSTSIDLSADQSGTS